MMDSNNSHVKPLRALRTSISRACDGLGANLHSLAEGAEQQRRNTCQFLADLGQRAGEQARRLQDHHQQNQQHAFAAFAVRQSS